jgi:predicted transglutaminase-like protease
VMKSAKIPVKLHCMYSLFKKNELHIYEPDKSKLITDARFEVFTAIKIQVVILWVTTQCNNAVNLKMEAVWSSETLVSCHVTLQVKTYKTTAW